MKKRLLALLLACAMMLALAACGGGEAASSAPAEESAAVSEAAPEAAPETAEEPAPEEAPAEEAPVEESVPAEPEEPAHVLPLTEEDITFHLFTGMNPNLMTYVEDYTATAIIRWLTEQTGVKMEIPAVHPATEAEQWTLMIASGDYADFLCSLGNYTGGAQGALDDEIVYDLNDMQEYMPYFYGMLETYPEVYKNCKLDSGSMPATYRVISGDYYPADAGMMVRADWLDAVGLEVPTTYDEYYEVLKAFKSEYDATMWMSGSGSSTLAHGYNIRAGYTFGRVSGLDCFTLEDGKVQCGFYTEEFKEFLTMIQKWMGEGLIDRDYFTYNCDFVNSDSNAFQAVSTGKHGIWKEEANGFAAYDGYDMEIVAAPYARHNADDVIAIDGGKSRVDGIQFAISTTCEHPELAAEWLDMWYSPEAEIVANWGLEGEGFEYDADGNPHYTELITNNPDGLAMNFARELYAAPTGGYMYNMQTVYSLWNEAQLSAAELWCQNISGEKQLPTYMSMTTEESEQYSSIAGDLITYVSENLSKLMLGELNLEGDLDTFISTIKEMGMDDLIEIQQGVYERYLER